MTGLIRISGIACAVLMTAALHLTIAPAGARAADDKDVITYRQYIMNTLGEQSSALGQVMSYAAPPDNFATHLEVIAITAAMALKSFEPKVLGGESRPEVWANWADFSQKMNAFAANTARVAQIAREKGQDAVMNDLVSALACKSCHELYRDEKKK